MPPDLDRVERACRVPQGRAFELDRLDPRGRRAWDIGKDDAEKAGDELRDELRRLQRMLYAGHRHKVLVVLQGMDTSGKDGTIQNVFRGVNPQGVEVVSFKAPSAEELDHDYLWRAHRRTPERGKIMIWNRSHYEDVLAVRVRKLVPPGTWKRRYRHIAEFERMLADEGVTILKFFLHISKAEQKTRLDARREDPERYWKHNPNDLKESKRWDDYMKAYAEALSRTGAPWAPWYAIPSDRKWYRNALVLAILVGRLRGLKLRYPPRPRA